MLTTLQLRDLAIDETDEVIDRLVALKRRLKTELASYGPERIAAIRKILHSWCEMLDRGANNAQNKKD